MRNGTCCTLRARPLDTGSTATPSSSLKQKKRGQKSQSKRRKRIRQEKKRKRRGNSENVRPQMCSMPADVSVVKWNRPPPAITLPLQAISLNETTVDHP